MNLSVLEACREWKVLSLIGWGKSNLFLRKRGEFEMLTDTTMLTKMTRVRILPLGGVSAHPKGWILTLVRILRI
jgi:hypothetical protein